MRIKASVENQSRNLITGFVSPTGTKSCKRVAYRNGLIVAGVMIVLGRGGLPSALGQEGCNGSTACPEECPVWCQPQATEDCFDCACPAGPGQCPPYDPIDACETAGVCTCPAQWVVPCCTDADDCETFPNTGCASGEADAFALTDLVNHGQPYQYKDETVLGLYIDDRAAPNVQQNEIPDGHLAAAMTNGSRIVPRGTDGKVDWTNGYIGVMCIGFSNPMWEFGQFIDNHVIVSPPVPQMNSRLVFVNGAQSATSLCHWREAHDPADDGNPWEVILGEGVEADPLLDHGRTPGGGTTETPITKEQVQVVWMKMVHPNPLNVCADPPPCSGCPALCGMDDCQFPNWVYDPDGEVDVYEDVLQHVRTLFPNVQQVFLTSRAYGGYANGCSEGGACGIGLEPWAYTNGFTVQELIRQQIFVQGELEFGPMDNFPLILWGPYLWAPGSTPNDTVLSYETTALSYGCWDWCANGSHASTDDAACGQTSGRRKIAQLLFDFFNTSTDPETMVAHEWFRPRPARANSTPFNGTVDRLQDFKKVGQTLVEEGTKVINFRFTEDVQKTDGNPVDTSCFAVTSTCQDLPTPCTTADSLPTVSSVVQDPSESTRYTVTLDKQIVPGHWTTLIANVQRLAAPNESIRSNPLDRVDLAFLPGDTNANGAVGVADVNRLQAVLDETYPPDLTLHDVNRSGSITGADKTRLIELLQGTDTTQAWSGYVLPERP